MSKKLVQPERPQMTIWRRVACSISKATRAQAHTRALAPTHQPIYTHTTKCLIFITFLRQQWCCERALVLRYTYTACLDLDEGSRNFFLYTQCFTPTRRRLAYVNQPKKLIFAIKSYHIIINNNGLNWLTTWVEGDATKNDLIYEFSSFNYTQ
jgi:hypothetical protein